MDMQAAIESLPEVGSTEGSAEGSAESSTDESTLGDLVGTPEPTPEGTPKPDEVLGKPPEPTPSSKEVFDWTKDARYGKMWKDPNDMYKSYRSMERFKAEKHDPLKKQYDTIVNELKESGYGIEHIKEILSDNKKWNDPENQVVSSGNYLQNWLNNPLYKTEVINYFEELQNRENQRQHPNWTNEQITEWNAQKSKVAQLEAEREESNRTRMVSDYKTTISDSMEKITKLADSRGFNFDLKLQNEFYDHCMKNGIDPKYMLHEFRNLHDEALEKTNRERIQNEMLESVKKNKGASIVDGGTGIQQAPATEDNPEGFIRSAVKSWMSKNR